jgi:hypothetical protein
MSSIQNFEVVGIFFLALTLGSMFFFAAIMTPLVFTKLPPEISGPFIRQAFPVYSQVMAGMTLVSAVTLWNYPLSTKLGVVFVLFILGWLWLMPKINHYRDEQLRGNKKASKNFNFLHRMSVMINLGQMWVVGFVLYKSIIPV